LNLQYTETKPVVSTFFLKLNLARRNTTNTIMIMRFEVLMVMKIMLLLLCPENEDSPHGVKTQNNNNFVTEQMYTP
jgi:hypothetical protein